jgi:hypothetical protein
VPRGSGTHRAAPSAGPGVPNDAAGLLLRLVASAGDRWVDIGDQGAAERTSSGSKHGDIESSTSTRYWFRIW